LKPRQKINQHDNRVVAPYPIFGPITPWFWLYPCHYSSWDYSSTHMQPYFIQYPIAYSNYNLSP